MKRYEVLFIALALGGCSDGAAEEAAGGDPAGTGGETAALDPPATPACVDREAAEAAVAEIRAARLFEVGELIGHRPQEAMSCYAHQISGSQSDTLHWLVDAMEWTADIEPPANACDPAVVEQNLATIRALQVVEVGDMIRDTAADHGSCYAGPSPCQEAADAANCERSRRLANVAAAVRERVE